MDKSNNSFVAILHAGGEWLFYFRRPFERQVMKLQHLFVAAIAAIVLTGCGAIPPLNFSVANVGLSQHKIDADLKSMTVTIARNDEKTGALDFKHANFGDMHTSESLNAQMVQQQW